MAWLIDLRRALHRHPELSWKEERTAERLEAVGDLWKDILEHKHDLAGLLGVADDTPA